MAGRDDARVEHRPARSAAWGVVTILFGGGAVPCWFALAAGGKGSGWFLVPAVIFSLVALVGLYCVFAVLAGWWPFNKSDDRPEAHVSAPASSPVAVSLAPELHPADQTEDSSQPIFDQAPPGLADWTEASLKEQFAGRTEAQGRELMEQHVGKAVRVSGEVEGVKRLEHMYSVRLKSVVRLGLFFGLDEPGLLALINGEKIVVSGQINEIQETAVYLDECKLIEARRRPS